MATAQHLYVGKDGAQELYRYIKRKMDELSGFEVVEGVEPDYHPAVDTPNEHYLYFVEVENSGEPDHYKEWIWRNNDWVCIGDNSVVMDSYVPGDGIGMEREGSVVTVTNTDHIYKVPPQSTVSGTSMYVDVGSNEYAIFEVGATITDLTINVGSTTDTSTVSQSMFEFTLPASAVLENVNVLDSNGEECLMMGPMEWPGQVTYQGKVVNGIATIVGYSPVTYNGPWLSDDQGNILATSDGKKIRYSLN